MMRHFVDGLFVSLIPQPDFLTFTLQTFFFCHEVERASHIYVIFLLQIDFSERVRFVRESKAIGAMKIIKLLTDNCP